MSDSEHGLRAAPQVSRNQVDNSSGCRLPVLQKPTAMAAPLCRAACTRKALRSWMCITHQVLPERLSASAAVSRMEMATSASGCQPTISCSSPTPHQRSKRDLQQGLTFSTRRQLLHHCSDGCNEHSLAEMVAAMFCVPQVVCITPFSCEVPYIAVYKHPCMFKNAGWVNRINKVT